MGSIHEIFKILSQEEQKELIRISIKFKNIVGGYYNEKSVNDCRFYEREVF